MTILKQCPFCGCDEIYMRYHGTKYGRIAFIQCDSCEAQTKAFRYYDLLDEVNEKDDGMRKAIRAWNRRTNE